MHNIIIDVEADLVSTALDLMDKDKIREFARKQLHRIMADAMRSTAHKGDLERHASHVLHSAKAHMSTENALVFANAIYEACGIDTRKSVLKRGSAPITLRSIMDGPYSHTSDHKKRGYA